jgi:hypothetical protein
VALSNHTAQARQQAETITSSFTSYQKMLKYAQAQKDGIAVTPLIFSSGGTIHKIMYKIVKKTFPDSNPYYWTLR